MTVKFSSDNVINYFGTRVFIDNDALALPEFDGFLTAELYQDGLFIIFRPCELSEYSLREVTVVEGKEESSGDNT